MGFNSGFKGLMYEEQTAIFVPFLQNEGSHV